MSDPRHCQAESLIHVAQKLKEGDPRTLRRYPPHRRAVLKKRIGEAIEHVVQLGGDASGLTAEAVLLGDDGTITLHWDRPGGSSSGAPAAATVTDRCPNCPTPLDVHAAECAECRFEQERFRSRVQAEQRYETYRREPARVVCRPRCLGSGDWLVSSTRLLLS